MLRVLPCELIETFMILCGDWSFYTTHRQGVDAVSQEEGVVCKRETMSLVSSQG